VLIELRIQNLLLIERSELRLGPGFNAITGETGAGKTVLAHAIDLLLGGKSKRGIVRPGASEAYVEGLFAIPAGLLARDEFADLRERLPEPDATELVLARRVTQEGRTRAYIEGRSATAADLRLLGGALVSFYGQHEHRKLTLAGAQLSTLDGFIGDDHRAKVAELREQWGELRRLRGELEELEAVDGRRERELGLIEFELAEIDELEPDENEHETLGAERARLKAVDALRAACEGALAGIDDEDSGGASGAVAAAAAQLQSAQGSDEELDAHARRVEALAVELRDVSADLRAYAGSLAADPERLAFVDERLDGYERLMRKHGGSVSTVIEHAERCRLERDRLVGAQTGVEELRERIASAQEIYTQAAGAVSKARRKTAPKLSSEVRKGLAELAMTAASFDIEFASGEAASAVDDSAGPTGVDTVEFMIAPNPGIAATPLRETASGGELSRVMLALLTAAGGHGSETFVFDEIDAGIGGHTAKAVGEKLQALAAQRQVICITHLPQVAAAAHEHFQIEKTAEGDAARTDVRKLQSGDVVDELVRMLGGDAADQGARKHARELIAAA
jgi:DNA repair protein RecN (Recombination protein N)